MAFEMQAGKEISEVLESFPLAITVAIPASRNCAMAAVKEGWSVSQYLEDDTYFEPRLMFTAAIL